jgi:glycosyltransferase involved in cell wall biosynthesis
MPAYNCEKYISVAIESIINQTYQNWELLITDDKSSDNTLKIIESFTDSRIKLFHNLENLGYLKTCNKLFKLCDGDFIAFQDADDYSDLNRIKIQLDFILQNKKYAVIGSNFTYVDEMGKELYCSLFETDGDKYLESMSRRDYNYSPNTYLFKKEIINSVGTYNDFFDRVGGEDFYWTALILNKFKIKTINLPLYNYRFNPNSITGDWSDNPKKMVTASILTFLINQRIQTGSDYLETRNLHALNDKIEQLMAPYNEDPSLFYRELSVKYFYSNQKNRSLNLAWKACMKNPFKIENIKNLIYFLKNGTKYK